MDKQQAGRVLHYQLAEEIGRGGNGVVYQALDTSRQQVMALKLFGRPKEERPEFIWKYLPALEHARVLEHDTIVTVHDVREHEGVLIVVSDLLDALPVDERLRREPVSAVGFLELATQMGEAIKYAHDENVVHGDLKATNILVSRDGHIKVVDFGMPFMRQDIGERFEVLPPERLACLSPRILDSAEPSQIDDLYALGVLFYHMLTGRYPYDAADQTDLMAAIREEQPDFHLLRQLGVHGDVVLLIERLLSHDASERCDSAEELLVTLRTITRFEERFVEEPPPPKPLIPARMYLLVPLLAVLLIILWSILASYR